MAGNSSSSSARARQGASNAANAGRANWSDTRRTTMLLDAYIGAPLRLSMQPDLVAPGHIRWNAAIDQLSKLEYGHKSQIEFETSRFGSLCCS